MIVATLTALVAVLATALVVVVVVSLRHIKNLEELALMDQKERRAYLDMATATQSQIRDVVDPDVEPEEDDAIEDVAIGNIRWADR